MVQLIDFAHPERNQFHAINQFRIDTPGCVKGCIIPDIVLFVNGMPLVVVEAKIGDPNTANPLHAAFEQLLRYRNGRPETRKARACAKGEPRLFYTNLLLIRTCGEKAEFGTITSGHEHFYAWKDIWPESNRRYTPPLGVEREQERLIQGLLAPATLLDVLRTCTVFMDTDAGKRIKVVCRYQQYRAARKIVERLRTRQDPGSALGRRLAHAGLGQVADHGLRRPHAPGLRGPAGFQDPPGQRPHRPGGAARRHRAGSSAARSTSSRARRQLREHLAPAPPT